MIKFLKMLPIGTKFSSDVLVKDDGSKMLININDKSNTLVTNILVIDTIDGSLLTSW